METPKLFRFRLWHLMLAITLIGIGLWGVTQYGVETMEAEIIQVNVEDDLSKPPRITRIGLDFLRPSEQAHLSLQVFLKRPIEREWEVGDRLIFRYRAKPLLGLKQDVPRQKIFAMLGIAEENLQEVITESGDREN